mgnify:CR=1 FL=1
MRILMLGDTHGDLRACTNALIQAKDDNCSIIVILGDFGFYPNIDDCVHFLNELSFKSIQYGIEIHWIKGNHENHEVLTQICGDSLEEKEIRPNVFYHPNGNVWRWDGVAFLAMGGAWSKDRREREYEEAKGGIKTWFEGEEISKDDIRKAYHAGFVDVLLSHDSPLTSNLDDYLPFYMSGEAQENRRKLQSVVESCRPKINFHGHFHTSHICSANYTTDTDEVVYFPSVALNCNLGHFKRMYQVFDTETFKKEHNIEN